MFSKSKGDLTDENLIRGCCKGQEHCFKLLYEKYYGKMLNVCIRYARDREEAKDFLQEGYIRVFKNLNQYQFKGSFEGWMRRVMVTTCINFFHKNANTVTDYVDDEQLSVLGDNSSEDRYVDVLSRMNEQALLDLIRELPPVYRVVFNLGAIEGYSHREIAETLGITESTSRSNLTKARLKLQDLLNRLNHHERTASYAK